jgi:hypothetical protein
MDLRNNLITDIVVSGEFDLLEGMMKSYVLDISNSPFHINQVVENQIDEVISRVKKYHRNLYREKNKSVKKVRKFWEIIYDHITDLAESTPLDKLSDKFSEMVFWYCIRTAEGRFYMLLKKSVSQ